MSIFDILLRLVIGSVVGFAIGLTGIGGGVLVLPSLTLILGVPISQAIGTASLYTFISKAYAGIEHYRLKTIDFAISAFILIGAIPANVASALFITRYINANAGDTARLDAFQNGLTLVISVTLIVTVGMILYQTFRKQQAAEAILEHDVASATDIREPGAPSPSKQTGPGRKITAIIAGILVGAVIGATSVGGGVLIIPLLILIFRLRTNITVGTSIFIGLILVGVTALIYGMGGQMELVTALVMAGASFVGVYFGSRMTSKIPDKALRIVLSAIILFSAVSMLFGQGGH
jgi:uncharacterized protein